MNGPTFRAEDGSRWQWNSFRAELLKIADAPTDASSCGAIDCVNGCDGAPDHCQTTKASYWVGASEFAKAVRA